MISDIDKRVLNKFKYRENYNEYVPNQPPLIEYRTDEIVLHFYDNKLNQIGLIGNYNGKLESNLGLGDLVESFEKYYGNMKVGDEDELVFTNLKGLCFEVDNKKINSDNWETLVPKLPLKDIVVQCLFKF